MLPAARLTKVLRHSFEVVHKTRARGPKQAALAGPLVWLARMHTLVSVLSLAADRGVQGSRLPSQKGFVRNKLTREAQVVAPRQALPRLRQGEVAGPAGPGSARLGAVAGIRYQNLCRQVIAVPIQCHRPAARSVACCRLAGGQRLGRPLAIGGGQPLTQHGGAEAAATGAEEGDGGWSGGATTDSGSAQTK